LTAFALNQPYLGMVDSKQKQYLGMVDSKQKQSTRGTLSATVRAQPLEAGVEDAGVC
jgi:hypothetical protein